MKLIKVITLLIFMTPSFVSANNLLDWMGEELESQQQTLVEIQNESERNDLFLNLIRVRFRATLSVELPLVAKGKIRPEIELYYSR